MTEPQKVISMFEQEDREVSRRLKKEESLRWALNLILDKQFEPYEKKGVVELLVRGLSARGWCDEALIREKGKCYDRLESPAGVRVAVVICDGENEQNEYERSKGEMNEKTCTRCNSDCHAANLSNYRLFNLERQKLDEAKGALLKALRFLEWFREGVIKGEISVTGNCPVSDYDLSEEIKKSISGEH